MNAEIQKGRPKNLSDITNELIVTILGFAALPDQSAAFHTASILRNAVQHVWERKKSFDMNRFVTLNDPLKPIRFMANLRTIKISGCQYIDLREDGGDTLLRHLSVHCKALEKVEASSLRTLTNLGCAHLAMGCPSLKYVDITFCPMTDYGAVLLLRGVHPFQLLSGDSSNTSQSCHNQLNARPESFNPRPVMVRRQPQCLDGHFHCPWQAEEIHTYYPDGSFAFSRETESKGWVISLIDRVRCCL
jgi:hypothetical protein